MASLLSLGAGAGAVVAQVGPQEEEPWAPWGSATEVSFFMVNGVVGAVTAGVAAVLGGEDFSEALSGGALGGALVYAGKRAAMFTFPGSGLLGRQVAGVGGSVVRNAGQGRALWGALTLPLPLVRIDVDPRALRITAARLDLSETVALAYSVSREDLSLDWSASLDSGAPVLDSSEPLVGAGGHDAHGMMRYGVIIVDRTSLNPSHHVSGSERSSSWEAQYHRVRRHELTHVLQRDFAHRAAAGVLEEWLIRWLPGADGWQRGVEIGLASQWALVGLRPYVEGEAEFLEYR